METLKEFNAMQIAAFIGGRLVEENDNGFAIYERDWGRIDIYDNGGEVNVCFEKLGQLDLYLPLGIVVSQYTFGFSIPYSGCDEAELASRLLFCLRKAPEGVEIIDYFLQEKNKLEIATETLCVTPIQMEGLWKFECNCTKWMGKNSMWRICLNDDLEFELWHEDEALYGTYKSFKSALNKVGITEI